MILDEIANKISEMLEGRFDVSLYKANDTQVFELHLLDKSGCGVTMQSALPDNFITIVRDLISIGQKIERVQNENTPEYKLGKLGILILGYIENIKGLSQGELK